MIGMLVLVRFCLFSQENANIADPILEEMMNRYQMTNASRYLDSVLQVPGTLQRPEGIYYLTKKSDYLFSRGKYEDALASAEMAISRANSLGVHTWDGEAYLAKANALNPLGKLDEVLVLVKTVFSNAEKAKRPDLLRKCYLQMGSVALFNNNLDDALKYYQLAYDIGEQSHLDHVRHVALIGLATVYFHKGALNEGMCFLEEGMQAAESNKDSTILSGAYALKAFLHSRQGDLVSGVKMIQKSLDIALLIQHEMLISYGYSQLLEFDTNSGNFEQALNYGKQAKALLKRKPMPLLEMYVDSIMSEVYRKQGDFEKSLELFTSFHKNKATILSKKQAEALEAIKDKFTIKEKNLVIQNQQLKLENIGKRNLVLVLVNVLLFSVIAFGVVQKWMKKKYKRTMYQKEKLLESLVEIKTRENIPATPPTMAAVGIPQTRNEVQEEDSEIFPEDRRELFDEMIRLIEIEKLYLNPNLDLKLVISTLGTNKFYLYQAMSQHSEENFRNLINRYRVDAAKKMIESACQEGNVNLQTSGIFHDAGFNSIASFYRIFKSHTGLTPNEYKEEYLRDLEQEKKKNTP